MEVSDSAAKVVIELETQQYPDKYDSCNAFVLPIEKKKKPKHIGKKEKVKKAPLLSKKRRKHLEKVVERKKKKLQRATLLENLAKTQASPTELQQYVSLTSMQNKGLKRYFREMEASALEVKRKFNEGEESDATEVEVNSIKGSKKRRLSIVNNAKRGEDVTPGENLVGFESSDSSEDDSGDENDNNEATEKIRAPDEDVPDNTLAAVTSDSANGANREETETVPRDEENTTRTRATSGEPVVEKPVALPAVFVPVDRKPEIQAARSKLPVVAEEQVIVETINENPVVIITGETGSGKTTQVPQFLYEAGYARDRMIGVTEPRRVAAMSMSKRVAQEMSLSEREISYLIRFEGNATDETRIKFMTDGVLLKEIQSDFLLKKYSVVILDEAHERSVHTDILIGLLSRIVPLRAKRGDPLKLIIMSATLRVEEFVENTRLFRVKPPVIRIETRQFPVTIHFNRRTSDDYVTEALRKAIKIHTRLPDGGILIFVTGQREVHTLVRKLRKAFPWKRKDQGRVHVDAKKTEAEEEEEEEEDEEAEEDLDAEKALHRNKRRHKKQLVLPTVNLDDYAVNLTDDTHEDLLDDARDEEDNLEDEDEDEDEDVVDLSGLSSAQPLWVLPLYSLLPSDQQARVFEAPPAGCRLCVVSTNVAETSLTIPNVRYVVDSGRCKTRVYDRVTGVSTYRVRYTSKAAASQRAGRAGRTQPGHCYRLYSSAVYNDQFADHDESEIQRRPVDDLVLQMKAMGIDKVVNFPFPTPPNGAQLRSAEKRLTILGALQKPPAKHKEETYCAKVTALGRSISAFPVAPRYGKMLALSHQHNLLRYTICMVAALSIQEVLMEALSEEDSTRSKWLQRRRQWAGVGNSLLVGDPMVLIRAIGAAEYAGSMGKLLPFCRENGLRHKAVVEIRKLRQQLTNEINLNIPDLNLTIDPRMPPPTDTEARLLRQILLAGLADQVARKVPSDEVKEEDRDKWKHAYRTPEMEDPVFMHSTCVLRKTSPEWVVYSEIYETNKMYMRGVTAIEPEWLPRFAPALCNLSEPLADPPPRYDHETGRIVCRVSGTFGKAGWELPPMDTEYPLTVEGAKWFAYFFLEGEICPKLRQFVPSLLTTPGSITKSWAKLIPRTQAITQELLSRGIMSKDKLVETWNSDKKFLLSAYQKWLPESAHAEVALLWPPL